MPVVLRPSGSLRPLFPPLMAGVLSVGQSRGLGSCEIHPGFRGTPAVRSFFCACAFCTDSASCLNDTPLSVDSSHPQVSIRHSRCIRSDCTGDIPRLQPICSVWEPVYYSAGGLAMAGTWLDSCFVGSVQHKTWHSVDLGKEIIE